MLLLQCVPWKIPTLRSTGVISYLMCGCAHGRTDGKRAASVDGWNTDDNIVPQWYGHTLHQVTADDDGKTDNQCRAGVWPLFSRRGYITANLASVVDFYGLDGTTQCSPDAEITEYMHKSYYEGKLSANQGWRGRRRNLNVYDISCVQSYRHNLRAAVNLLHQFRGTGTPVFTTAYIEDGEFSHPRMSVAGA